MKLNILKNKQAPLEQTHSMGDEVLIPKSRKKMEEDHFKITYVSVCI